MANRVFPSESDALESIIARMLAQTYCCLPAIVEEFSPGPPQIAKVVPAIMRKVIEGDGSRYVKMPVIMDVPVVVPFAQTAGLLLTLPIKKGDEGLIVFGDRMIDNFVEKGGFQPPECCGADNKTTEPRAHSLTDAIFIPGVISKPQSIPDWNMDNIELRDRERKNYISLGADGITMTDGQARWKMSGGKIDISAPNGIDADTPLVSVPTGDVVADQVSLVHHKNTDVVPGPALTGPPAKGV